MKEGMKSHNSMSPLQFQEDLIVEVIKNHMKEYPNQPELNMITGDVMVNAIRTPEGEITIKLGLVYSIGKFNDG